MEAHFLAMDVFLSAEAVMCLYEGQTHPAACSMWALDQACSDEGDINTGNGPT